MIDNLESAVSIPKTDFYGIKPIITMLLISVVYLVLSAYLVGFRSDQIVLLVLTNGFYFFSEATRKFITAFSIFIVYWVLFDYMKAFPNYNYNTVHIKSLYDLEKSIFGITSGASIITPNEYWILHQHSFLDVMSGLFYLTWIPLPLSLAGYLFYKNRTQFFNFAFTFLLVNLIGFVIYYLYPAAPPWYSQQYGFEFMANTRGNTAGLSRFDAFFNVGVFKSIYEKSSNVFAAMPSLHSSYPLIALYYAVKSKINAGLATVIGITMPGIWFAAVYTSHHYVLDVIAGVTCAITGIIIVNLIAAKRLDKQN
ncbi:phosphatase PAP2 family protein [Dyadobacter subterraneus]|uniref:Inositol phosphorylceramide synthase n=1 Tax=Dyadobacter subterraneus TaxID=2773304 RepID=A0ABR9WF89_9BACT|nr:phosphatase PAP2 family protein [Dyadobacter subterraneus]MBE9464165.1 inositol phosphorylceramide synthase [Dyadobacter subterraneus]